jgi:hypothetical protein
MFMLVWALKGSFSFFRLFFTVFFFLFNRHGGPRPVTLLVISGPAKNLEDANENSSRRLLRGSTRSELGQVL